MSAGYEIIVTVDTGFAGYVTEYNNISAEDFILIEPLICAIKQFKPYVGKSKTGNKYTHSCNYPYQDSVDRLLGEKTPLELYPFGNEVFDVFNKLLPSVDFGFHTIVSIKLGPIVERTELL